MVNFKNYHSSIGFDKLEVLKDWAEAGPTEVGIQE